MKIKLIHFSWLFTQSLTLNIRKVCMLALVNLLDNFCNVRALVENCIVLF